MTKKELSKGFTGIEINGVRFSNIKEMLIYMNKQKVRIIDLENENAELLCQKNRNKSCYSCANATERCFRNEIGCPCQKYKSWKEEIAELKKQQFTLRNERNTFLAQNQQYEEDLIDFNEQLTKAKEIIHDLLIVYQQFNQTDTYIRAERFLKEVKE